MAKRHAFVPEACSLEGRVTLSTFGDIGNWFSSQYHHVVNDLGISHKKSTSTSEGILKLQAASTKVAKPAHSAHSASTSLVTSNDTVKTS
jgi:hypothetical protein